MLRQLMTDGPLIQFMRLVCHMLAACTTHDDIVRTHCCVCSECAVSVPSVKVADPNVQLIGGDHFRGSSTWRQCRGR